MILEHKTLSYKGQVVFEKIRMQNPPRGLKPFRENEACFLFITRGEFVVRTPDELILFEEGKGLLAKCFDFYFEASEAQRAAHDTLEAIGVLLYPSLIEELFQFDLSQSNHRVDYNLKRIEIDALLNSFKESINILLDNPELADEGMIKTKLKEFVLLICKTVNAGSQLDFLSAMFKLNAPEFRSTIHQNLYSNLSIEEFARLCGMSISAFKRKFGEVFQESPGKYISRKKLEKASELLASSSLRVSEIAYDLGYETISTFNRSFKAHFGQSPSEYRLNRLA
ncbi:MAG: helix-turn-helix domain-containing protein [Bacteroidota bacterium]